MTDDEIQTIRGDRNDHVVEHGHDWASVTIDRLLGEVERLHHIADPRMEIHESGSVERLREERDALRAEIEKLRADLAVESASVAHLAETRHAEREMFTELRAEVERMRPVYEAAKVCASCCGRRRASEAKEPK